MTLGEWIAAERESLEWSQRKLAEESGTPQTTISALEANRRPIISKTIRALRLLCSTLGISILEAYHLAGLLDTDDEADAEAIRIALVARRLPPSERAELARRLEG